VALDPASLNFALSVSQDVPLAFPLLSAMLFLSLRALEDDRGGTGRLPDLFAGASGAVRWYAFIPLASHDRARACISFSVRPLDRRTVFGYSLPARSMYAACYCLGDTWLHGW